MFLSLKQCRVCLHAGGCKIGLLYWCPVLELARSLIGIELKISEYYGCMNTGTELQVSSPCQCQMLPIAYVSTNVICLILGHNLG